MQCQQTRDRRLSIFEFNGRIVGTTAARLLMGYDKVGLGLKTFAGKELKAAGSLRSPALQVVPRAIDTARRPEDIARLARDGFWRRQV